VFKKLEEVYESLDFGSLEAIRTHMIREMEKN